MNLRIHDTLRGQKVAFEPRDRTHVRMYVSGPTVYGTAHIGNARPVVVFDVLVRLLRRLYPKVTYVRNITDIEAVSDTTLELNLVPLQAVQEKNISIDSAWFTNPVPMPNQPNLLVVRVRTLTEAAAENVRLSIRYEGENKPVGTLTVPAESSVVDTVNISIQRTGCAKHGTHCRPLISCMYLSTV